jgi:uncharacterized protein (DUF2384 family)
LYSKQNHGQDSTTAELISRLAEQVFGNKVKADNWLTQPKNTFVWQRTIAASAQ